MQVSPAEGYVGIAPNPTLKQHEMGPTKADINAQLRGPLSPLHRRECDTRSFSQTLIVTQVSCNDSCETG